MNSKDELTYKVPQKDTFLKETSYAEAVVAELLESSHQTTFSTQQNCQTSSLTNRKEEMNLGSP